MKEIVVKKDKSKNSVAELHKNTQDNKNFPGLTAFEEKGGPFKMFDKNVTGKEMNDYTIKLQDKLLKMNEKINALYTQFSDVCKTFETLDKKYLEGINGAFNQAIEATKKAEDAQKEINQAAEALEKMVEKIKEFNTKLNVVDSKIEAIVQTLDSYKDQYDELSKQLDSYKKEKKKYRRLLLTVCVAAGVSLITCIVLTILIVFKVI